MLISLLLGILFLGSLFLGLWVSGVRGRDRLSDRGVGFLFSTSILSISVLAATLLSSWSLPLQAQAGSERVASVRATELRAVLPGPDDRHFFGLETIQPGQAVALTLRFDAAELAAHEEVNFVVLSEEGLARFLAGADAAEVALASGSPMLFDPQDSRRSALVPGVASGGYTVIVSGSVHAPVRYALEVQGGLLRDDAGQSQASVMVDAPPLAGDGAGVSGMAKPVEIVTQAAQRPPVLGAGVAPVLARRVTATLGPEGDRHTLRLSPDTGRDVVTLTLRYPAGRADERSALNIWVLTQDGVRHLEQGGRLEELNLASGAPVLSPEDTMVMRTTLRVAHQVPYVVVVYNQMAGATGYTLDVEGAVLIDEQGQTNEAQAAVAEVLAVGSGQ